MKLVGRGTVGILLALVCSALPARADETTLDDAITQLLKRRVPIVSARSTGLFLDPLSDPVPSAEAPILYQLCWWTRRVRGMDAATASRLLGGCERYPGFLANILPSLPVTPDTVRRVRRLYARPPDPRDGDPVGRWLKHCGADDVASLESCIDSTDLTEASETREALLKMPAARVQTLLERGLASSRVVRAERCASILYARGRVSLRPRLIVAVRNQALDHWTRTWAIEALLARPWEGRDDWYRSAFETPGLADTQWFSALRDPYKEDPAKWTPVFVEFLRKPGPARDNVVDCVGSTHRYNPYSPLPRRELVLAMVEWLSDEAWTTVRHQEDEIRWCADYRIPEALPALKELAKRGNRAASLALSKFSDAERPPGQRGRGLPVSLVDEVDKGTADVTCIDMALGYSLSNDILSRWTRTGGVRAGLAAAMSRDATVQHAVVASSDRNAKRAMVACLRIARASLPTDDIQTLLYDAQPSVVAATRVWLETLDTPMAHRALRERFMSENLVVGSDVDLAAFIRKWENRLRSDVRTSGGPSSVYALLGASYSPYGGGRADQLVMRIWDDHAEFARHSDPCYRWRRLLSREDAVGFVRTMALLHPEDAPATRSERNHPFIQDYFHVDQTGGQRVVMWCTSPPEEHLNAACELICTLNRGSDLELRFDVQDRISGVQILMAEEKRLARAVWAAGGDVRVLTEPLDPTRPSGRRHWPRASLQSWHAMPGNLPCAPPPQRPVRFACSSENDGLYIEEHGKKRLLCKGIFSEPRISSDGRWIVATRGSHADFVGQVADAIHFVRGDLVRVDTRTGAVMPLALAGADVMQCVGWVDAQEKFLLLRASRSKIIPDTYNLFGDFKDPRSIGPDGPEIAFYDADSNTLTHPLGEIRPFLDTDGQPLQPTDRPHVVWAAINDDGGVEVGRFDTHTLRFERVASYPALHFRSNAMWVDDGAGSVYVVYDGYVLKLPFSSPE